MAKFPDGHHYAGEWSSGKPHGFGELKSIDDITLRCYWQNGATKDGNGILSFPNGRSYEGKWSDGIPHGWGVYTCADEIQTSLSTNMQYTKTWYMGSATNCPIDLSCLGCLKDAKVHFLPRNIEDVYDISFSNDHERSMYFSRRKPYNIMKECLKNYLKMAMERKGSNSSFDLFQPDFLKHLAIGDRENPQYCERMLVVQEVNLIIEEINASERLRKRKEDIQRMRNESQLIIQEISSQAKKTTRAEFIH